MPVTDNVSSDVSSAETPAPVSKGEEEAPKKVKKYRCGEYKHVLLTKEEFEKLTEEHGAYKVGEAIKFLDEYIEMKGYKAKSHYLAIKKWVFDAVAERERKRAKQGASGVASSFETEDFFGAALRRSYESDPTPTAADDPEIQKRAEALREQLGG